MSNFDEMYARNKGRAVEHFQMAHDNLQAAKETDQDVGSFEEAEEYDRLEPRPRPNAEMADIADEVDQLVRMQQMARTRGPSPDRDGPDLDFD